MIIRVVLIVATSLLFLGYLQQRFSTRRQALSKLLAGVLFILAVISIISPDLTNRVARHVGVGRGADLLLYVLTVAFVIYALSHAIHSRDDRAKVVQLARRLAILDSNQMPHNKKLIRSLR